MAFDSSMMEGKELSVTRDIDVFDIEKSLHDITLLQKDIDRAIRLGLQDALAQIISYLKRKMVSYNAPNLQYDVEFTAYTEGFEIRVEGEIALFVEFGTGIVGSWNPHPDDPWEYDINNHGYKGWYYPAELANESDARTDSAGTKFFWTRGMKSRPYFYETVEWVRTRGVIARCINARLRKIK